MATSVFRVGSFRSFFIGQAFSYLGDGLRAIAIPLLVFQLTGSAMSLGITYALEFLPFAIFSLVAGSFADRVDRRQLMIGTDIVRFAIMVVFGVLFFTHQLNLPLLYTGVVLLSIMAAMFLGGQVSSIPFLLGKDRAKAAVAALVATEQGMNLIAPPVGGAIFALKGALPALLINAGTYFASTASLATVRDFGPDAPSGYPSLRQIGSDIVAGWTFIMRDPAMRMLTWIQLVYNFFLMLGYTTIIPYFKRDFLATDQQVGIAFGIFALGSVIGSIAAGKWHPSFGRVLIVTNIVGVFAGLPMIFTHDLRVAIFAFTIASMFSIYQIANIIAWRMRVVPEEMVGRVFGVIRMLVLIGVVPGSILGGIIADAYGARLAFVISSFGYLITTIWMVSSRVLREDRR